MRHSSSQDKIQGGKGLIGRVSLHGAVQPEWQNQIYFFNGSGRARGPGRAPAWVTKKPGPSNLALPGPLGPPCPVGHSPQAERQRPASSKGVMGTRILIPRWGGWQHPRRGEQCIFQHEVAMKACFICCVSCARTLCISIPRWGGVQDPRSEG